ncbi:YchJ family metal-binding protein [Streptomyces sp. NBC_00249]|uniref:YchJ family protein n=1 Tax=Streptomyces sp. NBC_00249 TaxID=2975690 RepID=UPI002258B7FE|nr:YchJ family metal-binding protein [Streptomyces sp. NBC_00249]MCX5197322.1 YchJ family metal-binding protein [Streptomyces sp. NBC_00249]
MPTPDLPCPCGLPAAYAACCGRFHSGAQQAPTAELLMRSRFTAFAVGDTAYLLRSWHSSTRPGRLELDPGQRWERLEILAAERGGMFETQGSVEFRAHYREGGHAGSLREHSSFSREGGAWVYVGPLSPVEFD